jgi:hypothetical protein
MDRFGAGGQAPDFMQQTDYAPLAWRHACQAAPASERRAAPRIPELLT